jgi:uncharacterized protein YhbP (UPF0306 family)
MSIDVGVEKIIRGYLPQIVHLSLATSQGNKPWVCEVHFAYDDQLNLYFRSLTSRRHSQELTANPFVAGNIVRQHALDEYPLGVYFEGQAEMLGPGKEQAKAFTLIKDRLGASDDILEEAKRPSGHQFYKITVDTWYVFGKLGGEGGKKYTLAWNGGEE